jgi:hypothetical protein
MKILAIGDIHGRDVWKKIIQGQEFDKVIFIGDYFDSFDIPYPQQFINFAEILEFKKANIDKVVLLIGNHDYHYIVEDQRYSGYQSQHADEIHFALKSSLEKGLMQICTVDDGFLFSHAGVTKTWAKNAYIDLNRLEGSINKCFILTPQLFKFMDYQGADNSGDNIYQSPIWVRPLSLEADKIDEYKQVVGHTQVRNIVGTKDFFFIDALDSSQWLEIKDGNVYVRRMWNEA